HAEHRAAGRPVAAGEHLAPALAAVAGLVDAALVTVAPELARHADVHRAGARRIHQDLHDPLRFGQPHVGPGIAAVGGLVDPVADRHAVPGPCFTASHPHHLRIGGVNG